MKQPHHAYERTKSSKKIKPRHIQIFLQLTPCEISIIRHCGFNTQLVGL